MIMGINVRKYQESDISGMNRVWNEVVIEGIAFPQEETLNDTSGAEFYAGQSYCGGKNGGYTRSKS